MHAPTWMHQAVRIHARTGAAHPPGHSREEEGSMSTFWTARPYFADTVSSSYTSPATLRMPTRVVHSGWGTGATGVAAFLPGPGRTPRARPNARRTKRATSAAKYPS